MLVSEDILRKEMANIFSRCWIYVGHASELKKPGDFVSRKVAGRPVIFVRDAKDVYPLPVQHLPPPRRHRLHPARGQCAALHVHLSRLDLRQ